ncbi:hypothetical protein FOL47_006986 [Perkinsus chesapeaki]|uniref:RWD domain-containing protein n=1 Tax=Perkinsus chesapeaki TaxID=330153 RepID=A0A7J6N2Y7_PERCH|nr:hypothetical protein FOL47_006986 [Perkinsus chesapeaki]
MAAAVAEEKNDEVENKEVAELPSLWSLYNKSKLTDCILVLPKDGGEEGAEEEGEEKGQFKVHKLILASYSRYCYNKIIPSEGDEEEDGVVVSSQEGGILGINVPILPDPHVNRDELVKCIDIINTFMYTHGDWERSILLNPNLKSSSRSSSDILEGRKSENCGMLLTLLGLSLMLDIPSLTTPLAQHIINTCLSANNAAIILLRCSYYIDNKDARALIQAAEDILRDKFEECTVEGLGKPLRVFQISQLPMDTLNRILGSDKLGLKASGGDERIVLRTCTNVLRQRMDRAHGKVKVEIVKPPREGGPAAVKIIFRVMEGIASRSECVRGCPVPRYETSCGIMDGELTGEVHVICPLLDNTPLGEVWAELEWIDASGEVTRDNIPKEALQKGSGGEEEEGEEEEGKEVELPSGGTVRVTMVKVTDDEEKEEQEGKQEEEEIDDGGEEGESDEDAEKRRKKKSKVWTREDFEMIYKCVRWSQLPLEALISAAESPLWHLAQDRILELMRRFTKGEDTNVEEGEEEERKRGHGGGPRDCQRKGYRPERSTEEEVHNITSISRGSVPLTAAAAASPTTPVSFSYSSDFDTFGCLYWLGTRGNTMPWRNPCSKLMEIQLTASSVGRGSVDEIVGRTSSVEFRTRNEPASWIQVDFGRGRALRLTGYCLRNRNSSAQCLMNWNIMGSNDGDDWILIDERKMCGSLREPKATSYFPVDKSPESRGSFRIFRLIQSGVNSVKVQLKMGYDFPLLTALESIRGTLTEIGEEEGVKETRVDKEQIPETIDDMSIDDILKSKPLVLGRRMLGIVHIRNKEHMKYCKKLANEWHLGGMGNPNAIVIEGDERLCIKYTDEMIHYIKKVTVRGEEQIPIPDGKALDDMRALPKCFEFVGIDEIDKIAKLCRDNGLEELFLTYLKGKVMTMTAWRELQEEEAETLEAIYKDDGGFMWLHKGDDKDDDEMLAYSITLNSYSKEPSSIISVTFIITLPLGYPTKSTLLPEVVIEEMNGSYDNKLVQDKDVSAYLLKHVKVQLESGYEFPLIAALESTRQYITEIAERRQQDTSKGTAANAGRVHNIAQVNNVEGEVLGRRMMVVHTIKNPMKIKYIRELAKDYHLGGMSNPNFIIIEGEESLCADYVNRVTRYVRMVTVRGEEQIPVPAGKTLNDMRALPIEFTQYKVDEVSEIAERRCRDAGLEELFMTSMKVYTTSSEEHNNNKEEEDRKSIGNNKKNKKNKCLQLQLDEADALEAVYGTSQDGGQQSEFMWLHKPESPSDGETTYAITVGGGILEEGQEEDEEPYATFIITLPPEYPEDNKAIPEVIAVEGSEAITPKLRKLDEEVIANIKAQMEARYDYPVLAALEATKASINKIAVDFAEERKRREDTANSRSDDDELAWAASVPIRVKT